MKISARNQWTGTVKKITLGAVNAEVVIALGGDTEIVSVITIQSANALKLKKGAVVQAIIKSSDVLIGVV